jgi:hypothetical protein
MKKDWAEIEQGNFDPAMKRKDYSWLHSPYGKIYLPAKHPAASRGDFEPWQEGEQRPGGVEVPKEEGKKEDAA